MFSEVYLNIFPLSSHINFSFVALSAPKPVDRILNTSLQQVIRFVSTFGFETQDRKRRHTSAIMLDPLYGLSTISSWTPTLDPASTVITTTTYQAATGYGGGGTGSRFGGGENGSDTASYWLRVLIKISILAGWFSERLRSYARLAQEACAEAAEERRLRTSVSASAALACHSVLKRPSPSAPKTFPKFSLLPAELRQQIWREALPRARLLILELPSSSSGTTGQATSACQILRNMALAAGAGARRRKRTRSNILSCRTPPPTLLDVNAEARMVALKHFRLGLAPRGHPFPRIYVNLAEDVIGLSNEVMDSPAGKSLLRLTPDLRLAKHLCLAAAGAPCFLAGRQAAVVESVEDVVIVESALFGVGIMPKVAGLDWGYWIRWQCREGRARWSLGGEEYAEDEEEEEVEMVSVLLDGEKVG